MKVNGKHIKGGNEALVPSHTLHTKIGIAATAGCLTLALIPAMAFAEPTDTTGAQNMGEQAPTMQQGQAPNMQQGQAPSDAFGGQAPSGQMPNGQPPLGTMGGQMDSGNMGGQAPSGQMPDMQGAGNNLQQPPAAPNGETPNKNASGADNNTNQQAPAAPNGEMPNAQNKELDEKIINAIDDEDIKAKALAGNPDTENKRPAIPEGEVNIQQLIDSIRHAFLSSSNNAHQLTGGEASQGVASDLNGKAPANLPEGAPKDTPAGIATDKTAGAPEGTPADKATDATNNTDKAKGSTAEESATEKTSATPGNTAQTPAQNMQAPSGDDTSALDIFKQIFEKVLSFLKGE